MVATLMLGANPVAAEPPLGDSTIAMPAVERVGVPDVQTPRFSLAATSGYGFTEAQATQDGGNHRWAGTIAAGMAPTRWLNVALGFAGRYDKHPDDSAGSDDSLVGEPRAMARVGSRAGAWVYGADAAVWLLGDASPGFVWNATTVDLRALVGYAPSHTEPTWVLNAGWRIDQSGRSLARPQTLRLGDRVGAGLSDSDALLLGLGGRYPAGRAEVLGELTADLLLGRGIPLAQSPIRLGIGARYWLTERMALFGLSELSPSERPGVGPTDPLVPIEPRISVLAGLRYRLVGTRAPIPLDPAPTPPLAPSPSAQAPTSIETEPPVPEVPTGPWFVRGRIIDGAGQPIPDAAVELDLGGVTQTHRTPADGTFEFRTEMHGKGVVRITSVGFDETSRQVSVANEDVATGEIMLNPALPRGVVNGTIRSLGGIPVPAEVTVLSTDIVLRADPRGAFSLDLVPGSYVILFDANGFVSQRRRITVEERGVVILNVDLRRTP